MEASKEQRNHKGIQTTLMITFSIISSAIMLTLGVVLYARFSALSREEIVQSTQMLMEQTGENLEDYLISMRQISDAAYYNVIKESDFSSQSQEIQEGLNLLYEANRDTLRSIAVYNDYGSLMGCGAGCFSEGGSGCYKAGMVQAGNG